MSSGKNVIEYRKRIKVALVAAFGGKCQLCGQEFSEYIYDFHHLIPETKQFGLSNASTTRAKSAYAEEAKKCVMVCSNCHRHIEYGAVNVEVGSAFNEEIYYQTLDKLIGKEPVIEQSKPMKSMSPSREQLKIDIRSMSMVKVGEKYRVSDNAVRKWCVAYGLPSRVRDIKAISDTDWEKI